MFFRPTTTTPRQRRQTNGQLMGYLASRYINLEGDVVKVI